MPKHLNLTHESNIQGYTYMILVMLGYSCELEYCYTDDTGRSFRFDLVLFDSMGNINLIIEFKRKNEKSKNMTSGLLDCYSAQSNYQLRKYCDLYHPIYLCVGSDSIKDLIKYILENY
jgi:hypothetical protein